MEFELIYRMENELRSIALNPTERNYLEKPKNNIQYSVNCFSISEHAEYMAFSEYLEKNGRILFVKLKFFYCNLKEGTFNVLGSFTNPHMYEKIINLHCYWDEVNQLNSVAVFSQSQMSIFTMELDEKEQTFVFKRKISHKVNFG